MPDRTSYQFHFNLISILFTINYIQNCCLIQIQRTFQCSIENAEKTINFTTLVYPGPTDAYHILYDCQQSNSSSFVDSTQYYTIQNQRKPYLYIYFVVGGMDGGFTISKILYSQKNMVVLTPLTFQKW